MDVFWKKTRGALCAGRDENMHQPVEPASAAAHTRRLSGEATSSDGETEALEGPVLGTHTEGMAAALDLSLSCSTAVCILLPSRSGRNTSEKRPQPLLFYTDGC